MELTVHKRQAQLIWCKRYSKRLIPPTPHQAHFTQSQRRVCGRLPTALGVHLNAFAQKVRIARKMCKCSRKLSVELQRAVKHINLGCAKSPRRPPANGVQQTGGERKWPCLHLQYGCLLIQRRELSLWSLRSEN
jgi:hypothetical protein